MSPSQTLPYPEEAAIFPVRTLRVRVLEGESDFQDVETDGDVLQIGTADTNALILRDETVSRFHVELSRTDEGIQVHDHGSTNGTFVGGIRIERAVIPPGTELKLGRVRLRVDDGRSSEVELHATDQLGPLRGRSPQMRRLFAQVRKAGSSDVSVLMVGESGTGKELIAQALHEESDRADGPFIVVDCASLTPTLVASELFGHEKGAFTGADRRHEGAFERANGGTIFLDEIGELPEQLQPTLLGVLERRRIRRLGGRDEIPVDVRVVAATHRDLRAEVNQNRFRLDLYYRIAVVRLAVPALRDRPMDIQLLIAHFLREAGETGAIEDIISPEAMARLVRHDWPGNVRELRNHVQATLAMGESPELDGPGTMTERPTSQEGIFLPLSPLMEMPYKKARAALLTDFEKHYLERALERAEGNVAQAARDCSMDRSYLWELLRRHELRSK